MDPQGEFPNPPLPLRRDPKATADSPDDARTESSDASSINLRIDTTDRKTPGSTGGGLAFPGAGDGNGFVFAFCEKDVKVIRGESGGVWSLKLANPRSRGLGGGNPRNSRCGGGE